MTKSYIMSCMITQINKNIIIIIGSCRAPTLLAELDDDDDMAEDENDEEDENEDDNDYEEVMVSRNLLSFMEEEPEVATAPTTTVTTKRRSWDDEYVLKRQFSALIPAFDPRPGRTNVNQTSDLDVPAPGTSEGQSEEDRPSVEVENDTDLRLHLTLRGPNLPGVPDVELELNDSNWTLFRACQELVQSTELGSRQDKLRRYGSLSVSKYKFSTKSKVSGTRV